MSDKKLMDNHVLTSLVESISEAFKAKVREVVPWYKYSSKHGCNEFDIKDVEAFEKAAEICYRIDADPVMFVEAQFQNHNFRKSKDFRCAILYDSYAEKRYEDYKKTHCVEDTFVDWEDVYRTQISYLRNLLLSGIPVEKALLKDYVNLKPWFRILITKEVVPEVLAKYREAALEEIHKDEKEEKSLLNYLKSKKFDLSRLL